MKWAIYYADRIFTDADGSPWDAPRLGVQVIIEALPNNEHKKYFVSHGKDYFYYEPSSGGFSPTDLFGFYDHLIRTKHPCPFFGRMLNNTEFKQCMTNAKEHWFSAHPEHKQ
jgi:hypothetical protein